MNGIKIIGILLIVGGVLGVVLGGFSFTKETHKASLGPISMSVEEQQSVNIPLWAIAAIVAGAAVLVVGAKK